MNELNINDDFLEYFDIVYSLIFLKKVFSVVKLQFLAFSVKNSRFTYQSTARKNNLLQYMFDDLKIILYEKIGEVTYIYDILNFLKINDLINIEDGTIKILQIHEYSSQNAILNSKMFDNIVREFQVLSDDSIILEVIRNA